MDQKRIIIVVGARPHFIKAASLYRAMKDHGSMCVKIVHSGQHYDEEMSGQFFKELHLPPPQYNLEVGSKVANLQMGECIQKMDEVLNAEQPDLVLVIGDTNTTAAAAIATKKRNIKLGHIEAGLREWDRSIPEEINKLLIDAITDYYFCPTRKSIENLVQAGITGHVYLTGDVSLDLFGKDNQIEEKTSFLNRFDIPNDFIFMTCHRQVNTSNKIRLQSILEAASCLNQYVVFSVHPRTKDAVSRFGLEDLLHNGQIRETLPLGFWDTQNMIKHAQFVITDSGGIIKESYYHGTPAIIIDQQTEWLETIEEGWHIVAGADKSSILKASTRLQRPDTGRISLGDGKAGPRIVEIIENLFSC